MNLPGSTTTGTTTSTAVFDLGSITVDNTGRPSSLTLDVPSQSFPGVPPASGFTLPALNETYALTPPAAGSMVYTGSGQSVPANTVQVADPVVLGWSYQTVVLATQVVPGGSVTHALTGGSATPVNALPTTGSASYAGIAIGQFVPTGGSATPFSAGMNATANFATRTMTWQMSNAVTGPTALQNPATGTANPALNLSGNPTWAAGSVVFNGSVSSAGGMSGSMAGRFYGPVAQEIGCVFAASGAPGRMVGGCGGKQ